MADIERSHRIVAIQMLRAIAAGAVAYGHVCAFAASIARNQHTSFGAPDPPGSRVALFFVVSGCVMVLSSRRLYGQPGARRKFWTRRIVRVLPSCWLATMLLALIFLVWKRPVDLPQVLKSLLFIPYWEVDGEKLALPFLWPTWTLFYELVFYLIFGLVLGWSRNRAVLGAGAIIIGLVTAGWLLHPEAAWLFAVTRAIMLLFIPGMALGWMFARDLVLPVWLRLAAALACVAAYMVLEAPVQAVQYDVGYTLWIGLPAVFLSIAVLGGPLRVPLPALWDRLGNISYSIYLLHVPIAWFVILNFRGPLNRLGAWGYLIVALVAVYMAAYLNFRFVERPLTKWLNARLPRFESESASEMRLRPAVDGAGS